MASEAQINANRAADPAQFRQVCVGYLFAGHGYGDYKLMFLAPHLTLENEGTKPISA